MGSARISESLNQAAREPLVEIGRVARAHGIDGGLLVVLHGNDPGNLTSADQITLEGEPGRLLYRVRRSGPLAPTRDGRARLRLWLDGLEDRGAAEAWAHAAVCIPECALPELPEDEFYWRDLIGARCRLADGSTLGLIDEIRPTGGADLLVVKDGDRARLLPASEGVLVRLDRAARELWVNPPAGFFEEE